MNNDWKLGWRKGFAPFMTDFDLECLLAAIEVDSPSLIQGDTVLPDKYDSENVAAACAIGYCGWQGEGYKTVQEVSRFFRAANSYAINSVGHNEVSKFFNWFDTYPRQLVLKELGDEIRNNLRDRKNVAA